MNLTMIFMTLIICATIVAISIFGGKDKKDE